MNITITLNTDNAAFDADNGGPEVEVARILREYAESLECGITNIVFSPHVLKARLRDINGNVVGRVEVAE